MKNLKLISIMVIGIMMMLTLNVYGASAQIYLSGETTAKPGETKNLNLQISTEEEAIGVVSGKLKANDKISNVQMQGENGWQVTYNSATGDFNVLKAEGAKSGSIAKITYTLKTDAEGTANISINNIEATTIKYETITPSNISKNITIEKETVVETEKTLSSIEIIAKPNKTNYMEGEKFDASGIKITAKYSDGTSREITEYSYTPNTELKMSDKKVTISYTENGITKTAECEISVVKLTATDTTQKPNEGTTDTNNKDNSGSTSNKDNTQATVKLPETGSREPALLIAMGLVGIALILQISENIENKKNDKN